VFVTAFVFDGDDAVESADLLDAQHTPGDEATLPEMVQDRRTLVTDLDDTYPLPNLGLAQGPGPLESQGTVGGRDRISVRVAARVPQELRQAPRELVRDGVLELLGLLVNILPRIPQVLR
jgi:hypothetical protein